MWMSSTQSFFFVITPRSKLRTFVRGVFGSLIGVVNLKWRGIHFTITAGVILYKSLDQLRTLAAEGRLLSATYRYITFGVVLKINLICFLCTYLQRKCAVYIIIVNFIIKTLCINFDIKEPFCMSSGASGEIHYELVTFPSIYMALNIFSEIRYNIFSYKRNLMLVMIRLRFTVQLYRQSYCNSVTSWLEKGFSILLMYWSLFTIGWKKILGWWFSEHDHNLVVCNGSCSTRWGFSLLYIHIFCVLMRSLRWSTWFLISCYTYDFVET